MRTKLDDITALTDREGIQAVLDQLTDYCDEQVNRFATLWGDMEVAKRWADLAELLTKAAAKADIVMPEGVR